MHLIASSRSLCHYFLCWFSVQEILKSFWSFPFVGQYQCFAKNKYGTAITNSVFVRKSELNNFKDEPPQTLVVNEGDPFGISCVPPDGWPKPVVYWMRQAQNWIKTINSSRYYYILDLVLAFWAFFLVRARKRVNLYTTEKRIFQSWKSNSQQIFYVSFWHPKETFAKKLGFWISRVMVHLRNNILY